MAYFTFNHCTNNLIIPIQKYKVCVLTGFDRTYPIINTD